jgi:hypothetical protein
MLPICALAAALVVACSADSNHDRLKLYEYLAGQQYPAPGDMYAEKRFSSDQIPENYWDFIMGKQKKRDRFTDFFLGGRQDYGHGKRMNFERFMLGPDHFRKKRSAETSEEKKSDDFQSFFMGKKNGDWDTFFQGKRGGPGYVDFIQGKRANPMSYADVFQGKRNPSYVDFIHGKRAAPQSYTDFIQGKRNPVSYEDFFQGKRDPAYVDFVHGKRLSPSEHSDFILGKKNDHMYDDFVLGKRKNDFESFVLGKRDNENADEAAAQKKDDVSSFILGKKASNSEAKEE